MKEQIEGGIPIKNIDGWDIAEGKHKGSMLWIAQKAVEIEMKGRAGGVLKVTEVVVSDQHNSLGAYSYITTKNGSKQLNDTLGQPEPIPIQVIAELIEIKLKQKEEKKSKIIVAGSDPGELKKFGKK